MNPCRLKVPTPILKHSNLMANSVLPVSIDTKTSCPQIMKIRNSRSVADICQNKRTKKTVIKS